jgi:hypothetical protein
VVERREQLRRGFARSHSQFSWTIGHRRLSSCTRLRVLPQRETLRVR